MNVFLKSIREQVGVLCPPRTSRWFFERFLERPSLTFGAARVDQTLPALYEIILVQVEYCPHQQGVAKSPFKIELSVVSAAFEQGARRFGIRPKSYLELAPRAATGMMRRCLHDSSVLANLYRDVNQRDDHGNRSYEISEVSEIA